MKQLLQSLKTGETFIEECPSPILSENSLKIKTMKTLISPGTEKMLVDFGKSSYLQKAKKQPEKVKMVLDKIAAEGLSSTIDAVRSKLSRPIPLGYSNVGIVEELNGSISDIKIGDRVVSNGAHADIVVAKKNLCVKVPDEVDSESAAFTVVGSIALQGVRLSSPEIGESFVVIGAGLIGLLTVQILIANGCKVLAVDFDDEKLAIARQFGAEIVNPNGSNFVNTSNSFSGGRGVDGVIITASSKSNDVIKQAATISRKRGRIILVGVVGLNIDRSDFYEKEISFQVSCSYGPGRYEKKYEDDGYDYPIGFVRWTEKRNFEAVLELMAKNLINVKPLISANFQFEEAEDAYKNLIEDNSMLGIILNYSAPDEDRLVTNISLQKEEKVFKSSEPVLGFIGGGNYSSRVLIPAFKKAGAQLHTLVTANGINGVISGKEMGFQFSSTNIDDIFQDELINTAIIVTQHNTHAKFVIEALKSNKNIWVEKPLAIDSDSLKLIKSEYLKAHNNDKLGGPQLMVGFNRRFSSYVQKINELIKQDKDSKNIIITVNAGYIPEEHWTQDKAIGGGRIVGEVCHFIDLLRFLIGTKINSIQAIASEDKKNNKIIDDRVSITLGFDDGSVGSINYLSNGSNTYPKERVEIFSAGKILQLDNFRKLRGYGWDSFNKMTSFKQDKGQKNCAKAFIESINNGVQLIPIEEIFEVAEATIEISEIISNQ
tara:strand:+ start:11695 stop:13836 length:2142 start_codon:yes stop_codon:yes gene_type:complete